MTDLLITSGLAQVTFAVLLGWPLAMLHDGAKTVGPFRNTKRLLQCHLDNIFMGILQMVIAAVYPDPPMIAVWLLLVGSWSNPQLFLYLAISRKPMAALPGMKIWAFASFAIMTIAYVWLLLAWVMR